MRSQSSLEFMVLAGFMFFFFIGLVAVIGGKMIEFQADRNTKQVQDIMDVIRTEIQLAATSLDGYERYFELPPNINGRDYEMGLYIDETSGDNFLTVIFDEKKYETSLSGTLDPATNIYKGRNFITKGQGVIFLDSDDPCKKPEIEIGANQYCVGLRCYCLSGFYDSQCNDNLDEDGDSLKDDDGIFEDDFRVLHCGNASMIPPWIPIDCVADDPCNTPPIISDVKVLTAGAEKLTGERNASISFRVNERFTAVVNYAEITDEIECNPVKLLGQSSVKYGPFPAGQTNILLEGLVPDTMYCFNITAWDTKGLGSSSSAGNPYLPPPAYDTTFTTKIDTTPPLIEWISLSPLSGWLGTHFLLTAKIDEPSGMAISKVYVNRTFQGVTGEYELNDLGADMDLEAGDGIFTANFTVEDTFFDSNASYGREELTTLFFSRFDDLSLAADYSAGADGDAYTEKKLPSLVGARFKDGVHATSKDTLKYKADGNFNKNVGTIQFWVNSTWDGDDPGTFFLFDEGTSTSRMYIAKLGTFLYFFIKASGINYYVSLPLGSWDNGEWHLVTAVWNIPAGTMNLYVDGKNTGLANPGGSIGTLTETTEFAIGYDLMYKAEDYYYAEAIIDQFRISNEAKTQNQILNDLTTNRSYYIDAELEDVLGNREYYPQELYFSINYTEEP